jgi:hypothetical protein
MSVKPADLTDAARLGKRSDDDLAAVIKNGGPALKLSPMMPGFASSLETQDIACLVAYVRTLSQGGAGTTQK